MLTIELLEDTIARACSAQGELTKIYISPGHYRDLKLLLSDMQVLSPIEQNNYKLMRRYRDKLSDSLKQKLSILEQKLEAPVRIQD
jgi:muconolactone delta-isomerase